MNIEIHDIYVSEHCSADKIAIGTITIDKEQIYVAVAKSSFDYGWSKCIYVPPKSILSNQMIEWAGIRKYVTSDNVVNVTYMCGVLSDGIAFSLHDILEFLSLEKFNEVNYRELLNIRFVQSIFKIGDVVIDNHNNKTTIVNFRDDIYPICCSDGKTYTFDGIFDLDYPNDPYNIKPFNTPIFKINDIVVDQLGNHGTIVYNSAVDPDNDYPIAVRFEYGTHRYYTTDGIWSKNGGHPEFNIVPFKTTEVVGEQESKFKIGDKVINGEGEKLTIINIHNFSDYLYPIVCLSNDNQSVTYYTSEGLYYISADDDSPLNITKYNPFS